MKSPFGSIFNGRKNESHKFEISKWERKNASNMMHKIDYTERFLTVIINIQYSQLQCFTIIFCFFVCLSAEFIVNIVRKK